MSTRPAVLGLSEPRFDANGVGLVNAREGDLSSYPRSFGGGVGGLEGNIDDKADGPGDEQASLSSYFESRTEMISGDASILRVASLLGSQIVLSDIG